MKILDVSMEITPDITVWREKDERRPDFRVTRNFVDGKGAYESRVALDMHTGTHIDAPLHFVPGGKTIESIGLDRLVRRVKVIDMTSLERCITKEDLLTLDIEHDDFLLFKTKSSFVDRFDPDFVYIERSGAQYLVEKEVAGVGTDALGVERSQSDHATHIQLLSHEIVIIEGLRLAQVEPGEYLMVAAPLRLSGVEASPARVMLIDDSSTI